MDTSYDVLAIGTCYVDTNLTGFPFGDSGIPAEVELVGGPYQTVPGGSAVNFCSLLQTLGLSTAFVGMAGTDPNGDLLAALLTERGIEPALIRRPGLLTNISFNMTNPQGKHIMLVAGSANAALNAPAVMQQLAVLAPRTRMLYMGGCFKLQALVPAFPHMAETVKQHGAMLVVDHGRIPQGTDEATLNAVKELVRSATYYLPSHNEFCELWGAASIEDGLRLLHKQAPSLTVVVKDGANGAYYFEGGDVRRCPAVPVAKVVDATGAGDSFNAGTMAALKKGLSVADAAAYGCQVTAAKISTEAIA